MLIMVSLVPLTGWSKQISLAQITFVGAGAFAYLQWSPDLGSGLGMIVAALFAVPFGVAMALPALRLQGLYLALASMAFAQMAAFLFFPQPEILGFDGKPIGPIEIFGFDFSQPFDFLGIHFGQDVGTLFFITFALGVVGVLVVWLHKSRFGRRLTALGDSPAACATLGINPIVTKLGVFVISAAIAGFAGALLGIFQGTATVQDFEMLAGARLPAAPRGRRRRGGERRGVRRDQPAAVHLDLDPVAGQHLHHVALAARPRPLRHRDRTPALGCHPDCRRRRPRPRTHGSVPPGSPPRVDPPGVRRARRRRCRRRALSRADVGGVARRLTPQLPSSSARISAVCSPIAGAGRTTTSSSKVTAGRGCSISPSSGCTSRTR